MLDVLSGFVGELRASGLPISVTETIDAADALAIVPLDDVFALRACRSATLVKSADHEAAFTRVFDLFFSRRAGGAIADAAVIASELPDAEEVSAPGRSSGARRAVDPRELRERVREALVSGERRLLGDVAQQAVELYGAVETSRPVGVAYFLQKTLRALDLASILAELLAGVLADTGPTGQVLDDRLSESL